MHLLVCLLAFKKEGEGKNWGAQKRTLMTKIGRWIESQIMLKEPFSMHTFKVKPENTARLTKVHSKIISYQLIRHNALNMNQYVVFYFVLCYHFSSHNLQRVNWPYEYSVRYSGTGIAFQMRREFKPNFSFLVSWTTVQLGGCD